MKKIITLIFAAFLMVGLQAQTSNTFKYVIKANSGIINTKKGLTGDRIDSVKVATGSFKMYQGATQLIPDIPASGYINADILFAKKYLTDTVHVTATNYPLKLTDDSKWLSVTSSGQVNIRVPADTAYNFPIGTVINVSMDGVGFIKFTKGTGVFLLCEKDSVCINTRWGVATLVKRAANRWRLFGSLTD